MAVARSGPAAVYAGLQEGLYKSIDGASSWTKVGAGLPPPVNPPLAAVGVDPVTPSTVFTGMYGKIYRSTDSGANFTSVFTYQGFWATNITIAPSDSQVVYVGSGNGFLAKSTNGGTNWSIVETPIVGGVAIHPTDPNTVYAAVTSCDSYGGAVQDDGWLWWHAEQPALHRLARDQPARIPLHLRRGARADAALHGVRGHERGGLSKPG